MDDKPSVIDQIYIEIKREVCGGAFLPGERVDVAGLCERYRVSKSPVRSVLYQLVGEGLLETHAHDGFYRPRLTPESAGDLINWMEDVLLIALDMAEASDDVPAGTISLELDDSDPTASIEVIFEAIAALSGNSEVVFAVQNTNDRLRAIRRTQPSALIDRAHEVKALTSALTSGDYIEVRTQVAHFTQRRIDVLPNLVVSAYNRP